MAKTQVCTKCKEVLPMSSFSRRKHRKKGYLSHCKKCRNKYTVFNAKNIRDYHLKKNYGISEEQYHEMYQHQNGLCAICVDYAPILCVDHCHRSNKVRGLLCTKCNTALGLLKDSTEILDKARRYIDGK